MSEHAHPQSPIIKMSLDPDGVPSVSLEALMQNKRQIVIVHGHERYRLRLTANGKLILTK